MKKFKSREQMERAARQLLKEIRWLLHKFGTTEGEEKEKYLKKIHNWYLAHPAEADIIQERLAQQLVRRIGVGEAEKLLEANVEKLAGDRNRGS